MKALDDKIHNTDWSTLLILDSFRYDCFSSEYAKFPYINQQEVEKIKSPGSSTHEVAPRVFPESYEYSIHSANPLVHNVGVLDSWNPHQTFCSVNEIEPTAELYDTVTPKRGIEYIKDNVKQINSERKTVLWLMQPHRPHLGKNSVNIHREQFNFDRLTDGDGCVEKSIKELYRLSYLDNVFEALWVSSVLVGELSGRIAITSDHGEFLFEEDAGDAPAKRIDHRPESDHRKLRHVPWLEICGDNFDSIISMGNREFIDMAYNIVLDRKPDSDSMEYYYSTLEKHSNGTWTRQTPKSKKDLLYTLKNSDEYAKRNNGKYSGKIPIEQLEDLGYL